MERSGFPNDRCRTGVFKKLTKGDESQLGTEYLEKEFSWKDNDITKEIIAFAQSSDRARLIAVVAVFFIESAKDLSTGIDSCCARR